MKVNFKFDTEALNKEWKLKDIIMDRKKRLYMVIKTDGKFTLLNLETGCTLPLTYSTVDKLFCAVHSNDDMVVRCELNVLGVGGDNE